LVSQAASEVALIGIAVHGLGVWVMFVRVGSLYPIHPPSPSLPSRGRGAGGMGGDVAMFVWAWRLRLFAGARGDARGGSASVGRRLVVGGLLGR
jgi:hypothetical protein